MRKISYNVAKLYFVGVKAVWGNSCKGELNILCLTYFACKPYSFGNYTKRALCEIRFYPTFASDLPNALLLIINPLKTNGRLLYLKTQFVPRSKHFSSRL